MTQYEELQKIAGPVSRETFDRLLEFERIFRKWSTRLNLAASSTLSDIWRRHILDSAQLLPLARDARTWIDIGSGGGFPGAIVAIMLRDEAGTEVVLVDSIVKKAAFLRNALAELAPAARIESARAEDFIKSHQPPNVMTARAVASLPALIALGEPWLSQRTVGLFHKGRDYRQEVKLAHDTWNLDLVEHRSAIDPTSVILEVRGLRAR